MWQFIMLLLCGHVTIPVLILSARAEMVGCGIKHLLNNVVDTFWCSDCMHFCFCWTIQFAQLEEKEEVVNLRDIKWEVVKGILVTHPPFLCSSLSQPSCPSKTLYSKRPNSGAWSIWGWPFLQPQFDQFSRMLRGTFPEKSHKSVEEFWDKCPDITLEDASQRNEQSTEA